MTLPASYRIGTRKRLGIVMSRDGVNVVVSATSQYDYAAPLPTRKRFTSRPRAPIPRPRLPRQAMPDRPRVVRMPSDWWDAPSVVAFPLAVGQQLAKNARRMTRDTFTRWGLENLADDAEVIVGEFVANAVRHGVADEPRNAGPGRIGLRLFRRSGEVMCAVLDPSDDAPVLRAPDDECEAGRGLQLVDALSDVWGWSPVVGRGKAVWAILFCS